MHRGFSLEQGFHRGTNSTSLEWKLRQSGIRLLNIFAQLQEYRDFHTVRCISEHILRIEFNADHPGGRTAICAEGPFLLCRAEVV
jgi:hypothetical protein